MQDKHAEESADHPQNQDEQSFVGHMPNPEVVIEQTALERAQSMGLYTEASEKQPQEVDIEAEISEQSVKYHSEKTSSETVKSTVPTPDGYTQTRTIAILAIICVLILAITVLVNMYADDGDTTPTSSEVSQVQPSSTVFSSPMNTPSPQSNHSQSVNDSNKTDTPSTEQATLARVIDDPNSFLSTTVTVEGTVNTVYTDRAFLIDGPGLINDTLLIFSKQPFEQEDIEQFSERTLLATGQVLRFNRSALESELGVLLPENQYGRFEDLPYILSESIDTTQ